MDEHVGNKFAQPPPILTEIQITIGSEMLHFGKTEWYTFKIIHSQGGEIDSLLYTGDMLITLFGDGNLVVSIFMKWPCLSTNNSSPSVSQLPSALEHRSRVCTKKQRMFIIAVFNIFLKKETNLNSHP